MGFIGTLWALLITATTSTSFGQQPYLYGFSKDDLIAQYLLKDRSRLDVVSKLQVEFEQVFRNSRWKRSRSTTGISQLMFGEPTYSHSEWVGRVILGAKDLGITLPKNSRPTYFSLSGDSDFASLLKQHAFQYLVSTRAKTSHNTQELRRSCYAINFSAIRSELADGLYAWFLSIRLRQSHIDTFFNERNIELPAPGSTFSAFIRLHNETESVRVLSLPVRVIALGSDLHKYSYWKTLLTPRRSFSAEKSLVSGTFIGRNPVLHDAYTRLQKLTLRYGHIRDTLTVSNMAVLLLPISLALFPMVIMHDTTPLALSINIILTDITPVLPLAIEGLNVRLSHNVESDASRIWTLGDSTGKGAAVAEVFVAECRQNRFSREEEWYLITVAVFAMVLGICIEFFAAWRLSRSRRKMKRSLTQSWHWSACHCPQCNCESSSNLFQGDAWQQGLEVYEDTKNSSIKRDNLQRWPILGSLLRNGTRGRQSPK